jgi:GTP-binding protein HflX
VGLRGPGETQLEVDRQVIRQRIARLKGELEKVRAHRERHRSRRKKSGVSVVAIVGYTNAGKSTLLNTLTGAKVLVEDKLFATLDPTTRRCELSGGREVLCTDTVGFIQKLPTQLVAAFRATLEEVTEADLLLHVVDVTHPHALAQFRAVGRTLDELEAANIPQVTAWNKTDRLAKGEDLPQWTAPVENAVSISALRRRGLDELLGCVERVLYERMVPVHVLLPYRASELVSIFHKHGAVEQIQHTSEGVKIVGRLPGRLVADYRPYLANATNE